PCKRRKGASASRPHSCRLPLVAAGGIDATRPRAAILAIAIAQIADQKPGTGAYRRANGSASPPTNRASDKGARRGANSDILLGRGATGKCRGSRQRKGQNHLAHEKKLLSLK